MTATYTPANGDLVKVTRTMPDGKSRTRTGVVADVCADLDGFSLHSAAECSFFAGAAVLAADVRYPIVQTVEPIEAAEGASARSCACGEAMAKTPAAPSVQGRETAAALVLPKPMDHLGKGEMTPVRAGRAARVRVGSAMSVTRLLQNLRTVAARVNVGQFTAADYLTNTLHADADFVRRYSSPYGKAAAAAYRERYGADPERTGLDVRGHRLVRVFAYTTAVLEKGAATYTRTAALIGA